MTRNTSAVDLQDKSANLADDVGGDKESDEVYTPVESEGSDDAGLTLGADDDKTPLGFLNYDVLDDSISMYLHEIGEVPLLKAAEERALASMIECSRHLLKLEQAHFKKYSTQLTPVELTAELIGHVVRAYPLPEILRRQLHIGDGLSVGQLVRMHELRATIDNNVEPGLVAAVAEQTNQTTPAADEAIVSLSLNSSLLPPCAVELLERDSLEHIRELIEEQ